jgi:hypothetical protein
MDRIQLVAYSSGSTVYQIHKNISEPGGPHEDRAKDRRNQRSPNSLLHIYFITRKRNLKNPSREDDEPIRFFYNPMKL